MLEGEDFTVLCKTDSFYEFCVFVSPVGERCEFEWKRKVTQNKNGNNSLSGAFFGQSIIINFPRDGTSAGAAVPSWRRGRASLESTRTSSVGCGWRAPGSGIAASGAVKW